MPEVLTPVPMIDVPVQAVLRRIRTLTAREKLFDVELAGGFALNHKPGQFVVVSVFGSGEAPISVSSPPNPGSPSFQLCVRDAGTLTHHLHSLGEGSLIGIRGPFGNGFPVEDIEGNDILFIAGGLGLAPLRSLIRHALERRSRFGRITILFGARSPSERLFREELEEYAKDKTIRFLETVDVGDESWTGRIGVITTLLKGLEVRPRHTVAAVCGPPVMYKFVVLELLSRGFIEGRIYMSLERRMCCGMGKCGQCQINGVYVCKNGPVFRYLDAKRLPEAL
ncbi:MAG: FAD/NAD(P)-binding protein [Candidatus Eisenbacteria bacterium]